MRKPAGKRLPHGATLQIVLAQVLVMYYSGNQKLPVFRSDVLAKLNLPAPTIDGRLRALVRQGKLVSVGHGLYAPPGSWPVLQMQKAGKKLKRWRF